MRKIITKKIITDFCKDRLLMKFMIKFIILKKKTQYNFGAPARI